MTKEKKEQKRLHRRRKAEARNFNLKLAKIYLLDRKDLSVEQHHIFYAAGEYHLSAFRIADQAKTLEDHKSLIACAEFAVIRAFGLKKRRAFQ